MTSDRFLGLRRGPVDERGEMLHVLRQTVQRFSYCEDVSIYAWEERCQVDV